MRYAFILILVLLHGIISGQFSNSESANQNIDPSKHESKNTIYAAGGVGIINWNITLNYERTLLHLGKTKSTSLLLRAGYGKWALWTSGGIGGILSANLVFFKSASHLETGFGAVMLYDRNKYEDVLEFAPPASKKDAMIYNPCINLGYRYQQPGRHSVFRIGLSYPEGVYGALGFAF